MVKSVLTDAFTDLIRMCVWCQTRIFIHSYIAYYLICNNCVDARRQDKVLLQKCEITQMLILLMLQVSFSSAIN